MLTVPHESMSGMFFVTFVQFLLPSRVICTRPSFFPAQMTPAYFDVPCLASTQIAPSDDATDTSGTGGGRPDDVVIDGIQSSPTTFAASNPNPRAARNTTAKSSAAATTAATYTCATRPAIRRTVLLIPINIVGNPIIDRDVIHLGDRQLDPLPRSSTRD